MKNALMKKLWVVVVFLGAFGLIGLQDVAAVEEHHKPGAVEKTPGSTESPGPGMIRGGAAGTGPEMMGMMGRMQGAGDENGPGMMGMMDQGMMRMMMSHMMGGPGGMGKMMGQMGGGMMGGGMMGSGMMGRSGAGGMMQKERLLEDLDLTPEQWSKVRALARGRLNPMADLWAQRMKLRFELAGLQWDNEKDAQQVKGLFIKEAEAKAEMFLKGLEYLRGIKEILTPEQLKKFERRVF